MLSTLRSHVARRPPAPLANIRRWLATTVESQTSEEAESEEVERQRYEKFLAQKAKEPPTRPQLDVAVSPKHGLYGFFRQVASDDEASTTYEIVQSSTTPGTKMGRSWNATELRRKSFKDLHTLWYIVLRERNLLATQKAASKRMRIESEFLDIGEKDRYCRKTMARIKQVLNERRLTYEQAYALDSAQYRKAEAAQLARKAKEEKGEESPPSTTGPTRGRKPRRGRSMTKVVSV